MFELRWKVEKWTEYPEGFPVHKTDKPVLQYRCLVKSNTLVNPAEHWTDWVDVPTEYIDG